MTTLHVDLHCHTEASPDSTIEIKKIIKICKKKNIQKLAITDHNVIEGALKSKKLAPDLIIIGEEISSCEGHIIALFINKHIPPHKSAIETVKDIKAQGGIVYIPHPFSSLRAGVGEKTLNQIRKYIDIIEVFNSRTFFSKENEKALRYAQKYNLLQGAGSDAHRESHLGKTFIKMRNFNTKKEFLENLKTAELTKKRARFTAFFAPIYVKLLHKIKKII